MDENKELTPQTPEEDELIPQTTEEEPEQKKKVDPSVFYWIRTFIGGYLVYLAWQLFSNILQGTAVGRDLVICAIAAGVFALVGAFLVVWSLWLLFGKKD